MAMMKDQKHQSAAKHQELLESYCQVCFVSFNKVVPKKLDEGEEICYCIKCKCQVHKCCYDMQLNSTYISPRIREFVCQRCERKDLIDKSCIICKKKQGALKIIGGNQLIHVFCGLMHKNIQVTGYFPEITFKKSDSYQEDLKSICGLCSKPNATEQCVMQSCPKKYHGYCIWLNFKTKQAQQEDPQCQKYYFGSGDNGNFDLSCQLMPRGWIFQQFDKVVVNFQEYGFKLQSKQDIKEQVYKEYEKQMKEEMKNQNNLKRGGFAYILCKDHESSMYCNCMNRGTGDMVLCQCCFEWYHQKCVSYQPNKTSQHYICSYCHYFYDLKKKIIQEVKTSKTQQYQLKFETPKLHLNDFIWILRVIDHRIAGGAAAKMIKELAKYPLKTSKMQLVLRNQNKKRIANLTEVLIQKYLQSPFHQSMLKPKAVLGLDEDQKPIILYENVQANKKIKKYVDFVQNFVRKNNLTDSFGPIIHELKFKQRAIEDNYDTILQLSKSQSGYAQIPILKIKVEEFSFMEVIKEIDSGSMIRFEDLEKAVSKATNSTSSVPAYLLKPLVQRYQKVKTLVESVCKNILQNKEINSETENAVKKLKLQKVLPPQIYTNYNEQRKFINDLYLFYLKQQGKPLQQSLETTGKIQILLNSAACKPNRQIAQCVNSFNIENGLVHDHIKQIIDKYSKMCLVYELRESLKKKSIRLSTLEILYKKYEKLGINDSQPQISSLMETWQRVRKQWIQIKKLIESSINQLNNITDLSAAHKKIIEILEIIPTLSVEIIDRTENTTQLGSIARLELFKSWIDTLLVLYTESQLKKNPMTISKLPQGLSKQNPLVKEYLGLKKQYNECLGKYSSIYTKINEKIESLKADQKKPRKEQLKEVLQKPKMTDVSNLINQLKQSKVNMQSQIKQLTKTVNKTIQVVSKVNKFISQQKYHQSIFKEQHVDALRKQIDQLRRKVLLQAEISLQNEFKDLYQAQICVRMQKMLLTANADLDKMNKLLKFAQQEGLNHMSTYKRLKSKFEVGNQSTKQINLTKKHEQYLSQQAQRLRQSDYFYSALVSSRKLLPLSLPQVLKQKNKHYEDLLTRNQYLKTKIDFILSEQPKKFQLEQAKVVYFQALKHPFEIQGLNKLIHQFQQTKDVLSSWRQQREQQSSSSQIFLRYQNLIFHIQEIESVRKSLKECEQVTLSIRKMKQQDLSMESLCRVEEYLQTIQQSNMSKNSKIYNKFKVQYYSFWVSLLKKFREQQSQSVPFSKIKSILLDLYSTIQKNIKHNNSNNQLKQIVNYLQDLVIGITNAFYQKGQNIQTIYENFIDLQQLKYEVSSGLDIKDQLKILNPFNDINRFSNIDLQKVQSVRSNPDDLAAFKRQRSQIQLQDPYNRENKNQRSHKNIIKTDSKVQENSEDKMPEDWEKNQGSIVSQAQRTKAKEVMLKNIRKNPELANYQNLNEQVKLIQNQLFGDNHNQIYKYFQFVNSFEKLFIKLLSCPNISAKVAKKKFQWNFLKLLISNLQQITELETILIKKNEQGSQNPINFEKKDSQKKETKMKDQKQKEKDKDKEKEKQKQKEKEKQKQKDRYQQDNKQKQRTIQQMIASGKIDESVRKEMKKQIKAIKDKNRKKKHKSHKRRSRSRSSSRSRQAKFSSESQENQLPVYIQKEYIEADSKPYTSDYFTPKEANEAPLLYDPELQEEENLGSKKNFSKGTVLQLRSFDLELSVRKRGKLVFKSYMMTTEDYTKITTQLIDPGFNQIQLKRDKPEAEIIQYLNKPSRKKYKFLVGWFEADERDQNQAIRDFAIECDQKSKIFGVQNDHIKIHIMSIQQYMKITSLFDPPCVVTSVAAEQPLKRDRLIFIIQYPTQKMYELKGTYLNFNNIQAKQKTFNVQIPAVLLNPIINNPVYMPNYMVGYNVMGQQSKSMEINPLKPVQYEKWGGMETNSPAVSTFSVPTYQTQNFNPLNSLSRFSPIMTDEEENEGDQPNKDKMVNEEKEIDLASNILNSLADVTIKQPDHSHIPRRYPVEPPIAEQQRYEPYNKYPPMGVGPQPTMASMQQMRWQPHGMAPGHQQQPMAPQMRINMPYNPMSMAPKYPMYPPPSSIMYKNPMMPMGGYGYPPGPPPPPAPQNQGKGPGNPPYDPYMYQRQ